jgi:vancomycin aglycone glucosyltransferase
VKFVLVVYGSRGDVEPGAAVGAELVRRGHQVQLAVPPHMLDFVRSAELPAVAYGPDSQDLLHDQTFLRNLSAKMQNPISILPEVIEHANRVCAEKVATLTALADTADVVVAGTAEQGIAGIAADQRQIPLAALHLFPARLWWSGGFYSRITRNAEDEQRRALGLPDPAAESTSAAESSAPLEIQAYEQFCLPGEAADWVKHDDRHPFIGNLTLEAPTQTDDDVLSWIAAGAPPIYFGFGSTPVTQFASTAATIGAAATRLGERALICSGQNNFDAVPQSDHVKIVPAVNHAAVLPACRAVVHHGGSGTTAATMRAGVPMLILWLWLDQPLWAAAVAELGVGFGRPFSDSTLDSLVADLRSILSPRYVTQAGEVAARMTAPAKSVGTAADLLEEVGRAGRAVF